MRDQARLLKAQVAKIRSEIESSMVELETIDGEIMRLRRDPTFAGFCAAIGAYRDGSDPTTDRAFRQADRLKATTPLLRLFRSLTDLLPDRPGSA